MSRFAFATLIVFLLLGSASGTPGRANAVMPPEIDKDFARVILSIAELRERDKRSSIIVTALFKPLTDRLSLTELRDYVASRYPLERAKDINGNYEYTNIGPGKLIAFDKRFHSQDVLILAFGFNDDWTRITDIHANLTGGLF